MYLTAKTKEAAGWLLLLAISLFFFLLALDYGLGSMRRMKAGAFPMLASGLLGVVSVLMLARLALQKYAVADGERWDLRPFIAVMASMLMFGLTVRLVGLIPAVWLTMFLAALGHRDIRLPSLAIVTVAVSLASWLLFSVVLGVPLPAFAFLRS